jgi:hypothetical protein
MILTIGTSSIARILFRLISRKSKSVIFIPALFLGEKIFLRNFFKNNVNLLLTFLRQILTFEIF